MFISLKVIEIPKELLFPEFYSMSWYSCELSKKKLRIFTLEFCIFGSEAPDNTSI